MHFELLVEDASGKIALESLVPSILGAEHTFRIISYKGVGRIPEGMTRAADPKKRILLANLPRLLRGYGKSMRQVDATIVVVVDAGKRDCIAFKQELLDLLAHCAPAPPTLFRIAVEEMEAWLLGDRPAVLRAYPDARTQVLAGYAQDSICDTWECLADAVSPGGAAALKRRGWPAPGVAKCGWAEAIAPLMDVDANKSKSFHRAASRATAGGPRRQPAVAPRPGSAGPAETASQGRCSTRIESR